MATHVWGRQSGGVGRASWPRGWSLSPQGNSVALAPKVLAAQTLDGGRARVVAGGDTGRRGLGQQQAELAAGAQPRPPWGGLGSASLQAGLYVNQGLMSPSAFV